MIWTFWIWGLRTCCPSTSASPNPARTRSSVTTDAFYIKWNNIQVDINLPCTFDYNTNAGAARSYGSEAEFKLKPSSHLTLGASGGYTNATFTHDVPALSISSGQQIPGVPRWSADLSAQFRAPVTST